MGGVAIPEMFADRLMTVMTFDCTVWLFGVTMGGGGNPTSICCVTVGEVCPQGPTACQLNVTGDVYWVELAVYVKPMPEAATVPTAGCVLMAMLATWPLVVSGCAADALVL